MRWFLVKKRIMLLILLWIFDENWNNELFPSKSSQAEATSQSLKRLGIINKINVPSLFFIFIYRSVFKTFINVVTAGSFRELEFRTVKGWSYQIFNLVLNSSKRNAASRGYSRLLWEWHHHCAQEFLCAIHLTKPKAQISTRINMYSQVKSFNM